jgi:hypothetical protein
MNGLNPAYLKLELAFAGVDLDDTARVRPELQGGATDARAVELLLPEDVVVDVPVGRTRTLPESAPYHLSCEDEQFILHRNGDRVDVRVIPEPEFYHAHTTNGRLMREVGTAFGSFIALSPLEACGSRLRSAGCRLCSGDSSNRSLPPPQNVSDVIDTVRAAFAEAAVEFVLFNAGGDRTEDGGVAALEPYIRAVKRHFDTLVAVQVHPPADQRWVDRTYAMGVDGLSYNVEVYDPTLLARLYPGRVRSIGRERYYESLAHAAGIFPSGAVWSELILGIEPGESTMRGIDEITRLGVLPVLTLWPAASGCALPSPTLRMEEITASVTHLFHAVRRAKINMGWVRDLSFAVTPLEARFFAGDDTRLSVTQQFYRSRLGNVAARNLARLRRRLRVRTVSDSFDSSHL